MCLHIIAEHFIFWLNFCRAVENSDVSSCSDQIKHWGRLLGNAALVSPVRVVFLLAHAQSACNLCAEGGGHMNFPGQGALGFLIIDWSMWWPSCCWQQYTLRYFKKDLPLLGLLPWGYPRLVWLTVLSESPQLACFLDISRACHPWEAPQASCPLAIFHWCSWNNHAKDADGQTLICNWEVLKDPGNCCEGGMSSWFYPSHDWKCWGFFLSKYSTYFNKTWIALKCLSELKP